MLIQRCEAIEASFDDLRAKRLAGSEGYSTGSPPLRSATPLNRVGRKNTAPHAREERLSRRAGRPAWRQHDKRWKVIALAAQTISQPASEARFTRNLAARHHEGTSGVVVDCIRRVNSLHHSDVIDQLAVGGNSSLTQRPHSPYCLKLNLLDATGNRF